jgi:pyruvate dehydrogenase E2 component (dihydrolipoamide acetyltransferase)
MTDIIELKVPDIGGGEVPIIELHIKEGDAIAIDDALLTLESDKASMDIPSTHAGIVKQLLIKIGDKVAHNQTFALIELAAKAEIKSEKIIAEKLDEKLSVEVESVAAVAAENIIKQAQASVNIAVELPEIKNTDMANNSFAHASPSVRKFARELGINDLYKVQASGNKNRITHEDIKLFIKHALANINNNNANTTTTNSSINHGSGFKVLDWPVVDFSKFGQTSTSPLSRIQKLSGANLHRNWVMIPHVTNNDEADITELEAFRISLNKEYGKQNIKITMLAFLIKACVSALKKFPNFNASLDKNSENIILKQYYNIGFAADTPNGLVVPVIKNADTKGIVEIAKEMGDLALLAREGKLKPDQMQGGCFSISSLGGIGGTTFTPIINAPEVAILGVCKSYQKAVWCEQSQSFKPKLTLPMSLSWDHRVIDGAAAARFNAYIGQLLGDFRRILL